MSRLDRQPQARPGRWWSCGLTLVVLALLVSCGRPDDIAANLQATPASSGAPTIAPRVTATPTTTSTSLAVDPELDPGPSTIFSPENMTAVAEYEADLQEERDHDATRAALPPGPVDQPFDPYTPEPLPTITTGVRSFDGCPGGRVETLHVWINNCWTSRTDMSFLTVYAGFEYPIPSGAILGGVFVLTNTLDYQDPQQSQVYWIPARVGGVTITQADGMRLTLNADDGTQWIFDIMTRTWEQAPSGQALIAPAAQPASLAVPNSTSTPTPTATAQACQLYPLALPDTIVSTLYRGQEVELTLAGHALFKYFIVWDG